MTRSTLEAAIAEAERFLRAAKHITKTFSADCKAAQHRSNATQSSSTDSGIFEYRSNPREADDGDYLPYRDIAVAAAKRASMDLTRALAQLRKPSW